MGEMDVATVPVEVLPSEHLSEKALPRVLGTFDMVAIFVAVVLFITNTTGFFGNGPVSMTYLVLGFFTFLIPEAIVTAQLGRLFPGEGSIYLWTHKAFGAFPSFLATFCAWWPGVLVLLAASAVITQYLQTLTQRTFDPWLQGVIALAVIALSAVLAVQRFRFTKNLVNIAFGFYLAAMAIMVLAGVLWLAQGHHSHTSFGHIADGSRADWFAGMGHNPFDLSSSASTWSQYGFVILALLGVQVPLNMGAEVADRAAVTRHLVWGCAIVMLAYLAVNWALMVALSPAQSGDLGSLALLVKASMGSVCEWLAGLIMIGFFLFVAVVYNFAFARLLFVSGIDHRLPVAVSRVNRFQVPHVAVIVQSVLACLLAVGTYMLYPHFAGGNAQDLANRAYLAFQAAVTVVWLLAMVFLFVDALVVIRRYRGDFMMRRVVSSGVLWVCSLVGLVACVWGVIVTFTNPWSTHLYGKGDWFKAVLLISVLSLLIAPIAYIGGRAPASGDPAVGQEVAHVQA